MSSLYGKFFLYIVMRYLIEFGMGDDVFLGGDALAVT